MSMLSFILVTSLLVWCVLLFFFSFRKIQRFIISFKIHIENETPAVHLYLSSRLLREWTVYSRLGYYNMWKGPSYWVPAGVLGWWETQAQSWPQRLVELPGGIAFDGSNHQHTHGFCLRDTQLFPSRTDSRTNLVCMLCSWSGKRDPGVKQWVIQADGLVTCWPLDKELIIDAVNTGKRVNQIFLSISTRLTLCQGARHRDWQLLVHERSALAMCHFYFSHVTLKAYFTNLSLLHFAQMLC